MDLVETLLDDQSEQTSPWRHFDLLGSPYPRPYQHEAYAVFAVTATRGSWWRRPPAAAKR
ncbi:MAG: hypothetical protein R2856_31750 [Caldilineaceae bacterium]